jgi:hypothetical protein
MNGRFGSTALPAGSSWTEHSGAAIPGTWRRLLADTDAVERTLFGVVVATFLIYAASFIYRTSFEIGGERYFSLFDDAMVSMRYAKNLAEGHGLVWNPGGERVEGYTNPLWVLYMSLVHLLPVPESKTSLFVQITAAALLAMNLFYVRRVALAVSNGSRAAALGAVVLTAAYLPINSWSLQGMEVSVLVLLTTAALWLAIQCLDRGTFPRTLYVLLAVGILVRADMVVPCAAFTTFLMVADRCDRGRHAAWGLLALALPIVAQTLFSLSYYGDVLPNTFYLKMTGVPSLVRVSRGGYVLLQFLWKSNPLLFLLASTLALRRDSRIWLLFWVLSVQMAYSVFVGGDAWEFWGGANRFICIAMPAFFAVLSYALVLLASALTTLPGGDLLTPAARPGRVRIAVFVAAVIYAAVGLNSIHGVDALAEAALLRPSLHAGNGGENQRDVQDALFVRWATTADATIAVMRAGTIPYFAGRYAFDLLGKNDRHVARAPVSTTSGPVDFLQFRPGHMKLDLAYSIGQRQPDVIFQLRRRADQAEPFLTGRYQGYSVNDGCIHVRRTSPHLLWNRLPQGGCDSVQASTGSSNVASGLLQAVTAGS